MGSTWKRAAAGSAVALALGGLGLGVADAASSGTAVSGGAVSAAVPMGMGGGMHGPMQSVDYWFAAHMADHHEEAVDMAGLVVERSGRQDVRELAAQIARSQGAEIVLLDAAAERLSTGSRAFTEPHGRAMGMHGGADLQGLSGDELDRAFLQAMIAHHRMGVHMAERERAAGTDEELRDLAEAMIETQTREIAIMDGWLTEWFEASVPAPQHMGGPTVDGQHPTTPEAWPGDDEARERDRPMTDAQRSERHADVPGHHARHGHRGG